MLICSLINTLIVSAVRPSRDDTLHPEGRNRRESDRSRQAIQSYDERCLADEELQNKVTEFLLSLPLGGSLQDAAIETSVGDHLLSVYKEKAALKAKLEDW